jgi:hypothetical protein
MAPRRALAGLLAAPVLVLTGCGDGSSVADPPVHSPPHSVATSDPPAHETAEHFIRKWAEAEKRMENTGKTTAYVALTRRCAACDQLVRDVKRFYSHGGYIHWNGLTVLSVQRSAKQPDGRVVFRVKTDSTTTKYKESASSAEKTLAGGVTREQVTLVPEATSWLVSSRARLSR